MTREEAKDYIREWCPYDRQEEIIKVLEQEPSVTPQPRMGKWSHDGSHWANRFICSECGYKLFEEQTKYCPNCGARMVEPQESEDAE